MQSTLRLSSPRLSLRREEVLSGLIQVFLSDGFLHFTIEELAIRLKCSKSTLYSIAPSKEQLISASVRSFFRRATVSVEERVAAQKDPLLRIGTYLQAISDELSVASAAFFADVDQFAPAREIYSQNTAIAARRVQELVIGATSPDRHVNALFIGAVAAQVMESIHLGAINALTSLDDSSAYLALSELIMAGVTGLPSNSEI